MNHFLRGFVAAIAVLASVASVRAAEITAPTGLLCDLLAYPEKTVLTNPEPTFGWIVPASGGNGGQTAYQILAASTPERLIEGTADLWDTGKKESNQSINIPYVGRPLAPQEKGCWKVRVWFKDGRESLWSAPQAFKMADRFEPGKTERYPLEQDPVPPVRCTRVGDGHYFVDFGKDAAGFVRLRVVKPSPGQTIQIQFGEKAVSNQVDHAPGGSICYATTDLATDPAKDWYEVHQPAVKRNTNPPAIRLPDAVGTVIPFRYVEINNYPGELSAGDIVQVAVHYPFDRKAASFHSDNPALNQVWELCKDSVEATSFCGVYIDGNRERNPYEADAYINQLCHYATDREFTLARYSQEYLLAHPTWPFEWKQHSILIAWADYLATGDKRPLRAQYDALKSTKLFENLARPQDGLLDVPAKERVIIDWPTGERDGYKIVPVNTVANAFYYRTLVVMASIAQTLEKAADAAHFTEKADHVKSAINEQFFDRDRGIYTDGLGEKHASLHANIFPLAFGLVPPGEQRRVADFIESRGMACSVYGAQYLLEALYAAGKDQAALALMTDDGPRSWLNMLRAGSTITLEAWDRKFKDNLDWNHAWGAAPANIIPRFVLGVRPLEAGMGKILIQPQPGRLRHAEGLVPTIRGPVKVRWENPVAGAFELEVEIPGNVTARIGLPVPAGGKAEITLDGRPATGRIKDGCVVVDDVPAGRHLLRTR